MAAPRKAFASAALLLITCCTPQVRGTVSVTNATKRTIYVAKVPEVQPYPMVIPSGEFYNCAAGVVQSGGCGTPYELHPDIKGYRVEDAAGHCWFVERTHFEKATDDRFWQIEVTEEALTHGTCPAWTKPSWTIDAGSESAPDASPEDASRDAARDANTRDARK
jgi:hypothetical protein